MNQRREGAQHIKLNLLSKSQLGKFKKPYANSSIRDEQSNAQSITYKSITQGKNQKSSSTQATESCTYEDSQIEKVEISQFTFYKLILLQKQLFFITITSLFFGIILVELQQTRDAQHSENTLLILMSIITLLLVILIILRKNVLLQLKIDQKMLYHYKNRKNIWLSAGFTALISNKQEIIELLIQIAIALIHPNLLTKNIFYSIYDENHDIGMVQSLNDLLGLLMILKVFIIMRSLVNLTKFMSPRVARVCNINQVQYSIMYSIKCIQKQYPIKFVLITVSFVWVLFAYGFRVTQGTVTIYNPIDHSGFQKLQNCFWFAFLTMYTVGYGEYVLRTLFGRLLASCLAIVGIGINSMLLVSVFEYLSMKNQQQKSLALIKRLDNRMKMEQHSSEAVGKLIKIQQLIKSKKAHSQLMQLEEEYKKIKFHMNQAKKHRLTIKNMIPLSDQTQSMLQDFIRIRQNVSQICRNQVDIQLMLQIGRPKGRSIKRSIRQHFKSFIKKTISFTPGASVAQI